VKKTFALLVSVAAVGMLSGCNDTNSPAPVISPPPPAPVTKALSIAASKGAIVGATCDVFALPRSASSASIGSGTTDANGLLQLTLPDLPNPVIVECAGGQYFDEALSPPAFANLGAAIVRSVAVPSRTSVAVTPVTELAAALALRRLAALGDQAAAPGSAITEVNAAVSEITNALLPGIDILSAPTVVNTATPNLGTSNADLYAAYLAGFSKVAFAAGVSPFALTSTLNSDITDGSLDGRVGGQAVIGYTSFADLSNKLDAGAEEFATQSGNADTASAANTYQAGSGATREGSVSNAPSGGTGTGTGTGG